MTRERSKARECAQGIIVPRGVPRSVRGEVTGGEWCLFEMCGGNARHFIVST